MTNRQPGLTVTRQQPAAPAATITLDDKPPSAVWTAILGDHTQGLLPKICRAVRLLLAQDGPLHHSYRRRRLEQAGVDAADGALAQLLVALDRPREHERHQQAVTTLQRLGHPDRTPLGWQLGLDAVRAVLAPLEQLASPPTLEVVITDAFREQRRHHRARTLELLVDLAAVLDVRVHGGPHGLWLAHHHAEELPQSFRDALTARHSDSPDDATVEAARDRLDHDGPHVALLRELADEPAETLAYRELPARLKRSKGRISQLLGDLEELGLAHRFGRRDHRMVELEPAGRMLVDELDREIGRQRRLESAFRSERQSSADRVCTREPGEGGEDAPRDSRRRLADVHRTSFTRQWEHHAAVATAPEGGIALVDQPVDELEDRGTRLLSIDEDRREVVAGGEYDNPLQWSVCLALGLASAPVFDRVLTDDVLQQVLDDHPPRVLRDGRCLGYLPDEALEDGGEYREQLQEGAVEVAELTRRWKQGDYEDDQLMWAEVVRAATGLATTIVHLLDLAGWDVTRLARVPRYSRDFDEGEQQKLARCLARHAALQSEYRDRAVWRQLFEPREDKQEQALAVEVDAADPEGTVIGGFTVVGPGVDGLEADLRGQLRSPGDLQEDAPEFEVPTAVRTDAPRSAYKAVTSRVLEERRLEVTDEAVALLSAYTGSMFDSAKAVNRLSRNLSRRDIRVDEVRYALATLSPSRILPDAAPSVSKAVHALLVAEKPLDQAELADRAGVSIRSLQRHRPVLEALDLLRWTDDGVRLALSFRTDAERVSPVVPEPVASDVRLSEVLLDVVLPIIEDGSRLADPADPVSDAFTVPSNPHPVAEEWPELAPWVDVASALTGTPGAGHDRRVSFGPEPAQSALTAPVSDSGGEVPG